MEETLFSMMQLYDRGVEIKVLVGGIRNQRRPKPMLEKMKQFEQLPPIPFRYTSVATNSFDVIDGKKILLKFMNPVNLTQYFAAIYVWQKRFALELRERFDQMWDEAKELPK